MFCLGVHLKSKAVSRAGSLTHACHHTPRKFLGDGPDIASFAMSAELDDSSRPWLLSQLPFFKPLGWSKLESISISHGDTKTTEKDHSNSPWP